MKVSFRLVTIDDAEKIFLWLNDPQTRQSSLNQEQVEWESHLSWLQSKLKDPNYYLHMGEIEGKVVGYFRAKIDVNEEFGKYGYISYMMDPSHRGKGMGKSLVHAYVDLWPTIPVVLEVKENNAASVHIIKTVPNIEELSPRQLEDGTKLLRFIRKV